MTRRTKKAYSDLYDNPQALFAGCEVILWPNGESEIWIRGRGNGMYRIVASQGPHGLGLTISGAVGCRTMMVRAYDQDYNGGRVFERAHEVSLTQYEHTQKAEQFADWYDDVNCDGEGRIEHP